MWKSQQKILHLYHSYPIQKNIEAKFSGKILHKSLQFIFRLHYYEKTSTVNSTKYFWFPSPTQLFTHGQWWSIRLTHLPHTLQWCARSGFTLLLQQSIIESSLLRNIISYCQLLLSGKCLANNVSSLTLYYSNIQQRKYPMILQIFDLHLSQ